MNMEVQEPGVTEIPGGNLADERPPCVSWVGTPRKLLSRAMPKEIKWERYEACWETRWQEYLKMLQDPNWGWRPPPCPGFPSEEDAEDFRPSSKGEMAEMNLVPKIASKTDTWRGLGREGSGLEHTVKVKEETTEEEEEKEEEEKESISLEMRRQDFRCFPYQEAKGPREICRQLLGLCRQWLKPDVHPMERIVDLLVLEQFLAILPEEMQSWVKEAGAQSCAQAVTLAEHFLLRLPKAEKTERQVLESFEEVIVNSPENKWELPETKDQMPLLMEPEFEGEREAEWLQAVKDERQTSENATESSLPPRPVEAVESDKSPERDRWEFSQAPEVEETPGNQQGPKSHRENLPGKTRRNGFLCQEGGLCFNESSLPERTSGSITKMAAAKRRKSLAQSSSRGHHRKEPYECSYCGKKWPCQSQLLRHESIHTGEKPYKCVKCGKSFNRRSNLTTHERTHTGEKPHKCPQCGKSFIRRTHLNKHKMTHLKDKSCNCTGCRRPSGLALSPHPNINPRAQAFGRSFLDGKRAPSEEPPGPGKLNKCSHCGKSFSCHTRFLCHEKSHAKEKPYRCPDCGKTFCTSSNLSQHKTTHTGKRPHCCRHCGKSYRRKSSLVQHEQEVCQKVGSLNAPPVGFVVLGNCALLCMKPSSEAETNGPLVPQAEGALLAPPPSNISTGSMQ